MAPWRMREATSISGFGGEAAEGGGEREAADADEEEPLAAVDVAEPPPVISPAAKASAYPAVIHWIGLNEAPVSRWMLGSRR